MTMTNLTTSTVNLNTREQTVKFDTLKIVAKLDVPAGQRLCRIINKGDKESVGAHVPALSLEDMQLMMAESPKVNSFIADCFHGMQDKLARTSLQVGNIIPNSVFNFASLLSYIESEQESKGRISKEAIETWFMSDLYPLLVQALKSKGITASKQVEDTSNAFKASFSSLAGRNISMEEKVKSQLEKALSLLPDTYESTVAECIAGKLVDAKPASAMIDAL